MSCGSVSTVRLPCYEHYTQFAMWRVPQSVSHIYIDFILFSHIWTRRIKKLIIYKYFYSQMLAMDSWMIKKSSPQYPQASFRSCPSFLDFGMLLTGLQRATRYIFIYCHQQQTNQSLNTRSQQLHIVKQCQKVWFTSPIYFMLQTLRY